MATTRTVYELAELHGGTPVFLDRTAAGVALAGMLQGYHGTDALVLAIPAGGVPVAAEVAARLALPLGIRRRLFSLKNSAARTLIGVTVLSRTSGIGSCARNRTFTISRIWMMGYAHCSASLGGL
jgi:hypothetical protein